MSGTSQFGLLKTRRLCPLFITQFLGAFNDNVYKQALILMLVYGSIIADEDIDLVVNAAAALFVLPFFLFSATAGTMADRFEKSSLIRKIKLAEIVIAMLAVTALYTQNIFALLAVLFLLGVQSTFFGPLKFSILPQHLHETELVGGNGVIEMGTFVAILLGTIMGGVIAGMKGVSIGLSVMVTGVAIAGFLSSLRIPEAAPGFTDRPDWNPFRETVSLIRYAAEKKSVFQSVLGVSWFWLVGSVYISQIANLTNTYLNGTAYVVTLILAVFTIAIAVGSLACERLSGRKIEIGLVPVGAFGVSLFGFDAYWAINAIDADSPRGVIEFLTAQGTYRLLFDLGLMGMFSGMFVVPLQALIQSRTPQDRRARVIAANNILNSLFMVTGACIAIVWLTVLDWSIPSLFLLMSVLNAAVAIYIFRNVPEFTMRFLVWIISHGMYRVKHQGLDRIPDRGAAVIVCNHVSYMDAMLLAGAVRRPIRFVMYKPIYDLPVLNFVFRVGRAIPITRREEDQEAYERAFSEIREALGAGDLICLFPEGRLSPDGELGEFKPGVEKIISETPVPVIPAALSGLWGSFFSRSGKGAFRHPNRFWSRIQISISDALAPNDARAEVLREEVLALRGELR
ncbi:MAG: MFS transporter [Gammaproteobacteria bacterium]|nr:MFS transporter [Gammaproteobacteria bacterium]